MTDRYRMRGVSSSKEEVHAAIRGLDKGLYPTAFCKVVEDRLAGDEAFCNVMHADGAGTKSALAYLYWKETGDMSVWKGVAHDAVVMNVDDLLCVGIQGGVLLSSTIGRNARRIPGEVIAAIITGVEETLSLLRDQGFDIASTGGETADVGDLVQTLAVDSTVVARLLRAQVIANDRMAPHDVVVGLASFGQAHYEDTYNAGMGSNGLTSARHDVLHKVYATRYPETIDPCTPPELVYAGACRLTDPVDGLPLNVGQALLSPTRTYAPVLCRAFKTLRPHIHGMVHCSGGGQTKALRFLRELHVVKDNLFDTPPLFRLIQQQSQTDWKEMYRVFNMGHRMEVYLGAEPAEELIAIAREVGVEARVIGTVRKSSHSRVTVVSPHGRFDYVEEK